MSRDDLRPNIDKIIKLIKDKWKDNVSKVQFQIANTSRANIFKIEMVMYGDYNVRIEYENSMMEILILYKGNFITLDELTNEKVYIGFDSCEPENLQHNFEVLDRTLCKMMKNT